MAILTTPAITSSKARSSGTLTPTLTLPLPLTLTLTPTLRLTLPGEVEWLGEHPRLAAVCAIDMPMHNWKVSPNPNPRPTLSLTLTLTLTLTPALTLTLILTLTLAYAHMHNCKVSPYVRGAPPPINTLSPSAASLARLKAGNDRFLVGQPSPHSEIAPEPFAIVVGGAEVRGGGGGGGDGGGDGGGGGGGGGGDGGGGWYSLTTCD